MIISINNAVQATYIFIAIFVVAFFLSLRRRTDGEVFSVSLTHELKGLAILAIMFSHIGYFLVSDHRFLFPLSIMAGVGVNIFLFLSGFGLAVSSMRKDYTVWQFYKRRILKLLIPFWIVLVMFFVADFFILNIGYSWDYIIRSFIGLFPRADLATDVNSPLWYFTAILFYYLIFPIIFFKKHPWLSALFLYAVGVVIIQIEPKYFTEVLRLYQVHTIAFPIGVFVGSMLFSSNKIRSYLFYKFQKIALHIRQTNLAVKIRHHKKENTVHYKFLNTVIQLGELMVVVFLLAIALYTAYHSGVGNLPDLEQFISLVTMFALLAIFLIKKVDINLFHIFGFYSYEIYLLHWPILSRYDIFLKIMPSWLAVVIYLVFFLALGWLLKKISKNISKFV